MTCSLILANEFMLPYLIHNGLDLDGVKKKKKKKANKILKVPTSLGELLLNGYKFLSEVMKKS